MKILFVHQGFPGQYIHVLRHLAAARQHTLVGIGMVPRPDGLPEEVTYLRYGVQRGNGKDVHPLALETESKLIRAEGCARVAHQLREKGFVPQLICCHPGWGEGLFLKDIWPEAGLLTYQEFFYNPQGFDYDFDPEFKESSKEAWPALAKLRMKTANQLLHLQASDWCVTATEFQRSSFPSIWQPRISVIHEGVDTQRVAPDPEVAPLNLRDGTSIRRGEPIVTFVNRRIEPYRGCHTFLRSLPMLQQLHPEARVVIVGEEQGVSYGADAPGGSWKTIFLKEVEGQIDPSRVHFTGPLPYDAFLQLLKISAVHVYLTYPFVLSWSLLEAMSSACAVVGSATPPVQEVVEDGVNGLLVDFFSPGDLAKAIADLLRDRERAARLGQAAREMVLSRYRLDQCIGQQLALMQLVAGGSLRAN